MSGEAERREQRVFLVVIDESPELLNALRYACRRAKRTGGRVAMLYVMEPPEGQQWGAVVDLMRQEARQQAEEIVGRHAESVVSMTGQPPAIHIREGVSRDQLLRGRAPPQTRSLAPRHRCGFARSSSRREARSWHRR